MKTGTSYTQLYNNKLLSVCEIMNYILLCHHTEIFEKHCCKPKTGYYHESLKSRNVEPALSSH